MVLLPSCSQRRNQQAFLKIPISAARQKGQAVDEAPAGTGTRGGNQAPAPPSASPHSPLSARSPRHGAWLSSSSRGAYPPCIFLPWTHATLSAPVEAAAAHPGLIPPAGCFPPASCPASSRRRRCRDNRRSSGTPCRNGSRKRRSEEHTSELQ